MPHTKCVNDFRYREVTLCYLELQYMERPQPDARRRGLGGDAASMSDTMECPRLIGQLRLLFHVDLYRFG